MQGSFARLCRDLTSSVSGSNQTFLHCSQELPLVSFGTLEIVSICRDAQIDSKQ